MDGFEPSPQQSRLYTWQERFGRGPFGSNVQFRISDSWSERDVRGALKDVVRHHEILRTRVEELSSVRGPVQVIQDEPCIFVLDANDEHGPDAVDVSAAEGLRVSFCRGGDALEVWIHAAAEILDWQSCLNVVRELDRRLRGDGLHEDVLQYADYAAFANEALDAPETENGRAFWSSRRYPAAETALAIERTSRGSGFAPRSCARSVVDLHREVLAFCQQHEISSELFWLTCWSCVLLRHLGSTSVTIASVNHGRVFDQMDSAVGLYQQAIPVSYQTDTAQTFLGRLAALAEQAAESSNWIDAFDWQHLPSHVVSAKFLFDYMAGGEIPGVVVSDANCCHEPFALKLSVKAFEGQSRIAVDYDTGRIDGSLAEGMLGQVCALAVDALARPRVGVDRLRLLSDGDGCRLEAAQNSTDVDNGWRDCTLHGLFERKVDEVPQNTALIASDGKEVSYASLDQRANRLAHRLKSAGVKRGDIVALLLSPSPEVIVSMLAVLKTGAAYTPIDTDSPRARIDHILNETSATLLISSNSFRESLGDLVCPFLNLDDETRRLPEEDPGRLGMTVSSDDLAYVIYTSGSTGKPKGIETEHGPVCNLILWGQQELTNRSADRVLFKTPYTFDVSVKETFWPLAAGATVVVAAPLGHRDPAYLVSTIKKNSVSILYVVPTMLRLLLGNDGFASCTSLRRICCGGETLTVTLARALHEQLRVQLVNMYGPTEAAVNASARVVSGAEDRLTVPIGRPLANTHIHIQDPEGHPLPIGVAGLLKIAGVPVARGYLGDGALTATRFSQDPYRQDLRMYDSGDIARRLPDGNIEFIGRQDHQVKLHGLRIELGEIESVLESAPGVARAVVELRELTPGDPRLVAYYTGYTGPVEALKTHLAKDLPSYIVPNLFVQLRSIPLTNTGKVDRAALPEPVVGSDVAFVEASSDTQRYLVDMWRDMLAVDRVGIKDNFFELGGDSIQGAIFCNRLQSQLGEYVSVVAIFEKPTIEGFAAYLEDTHPQALQHIGGTGRPASADDDVDQIRHVSDELGQLPLTPYQLRTWFIDALEDRNPAYNTFIALELTGELDVQALADSLRDMARDHPILRTGYGMSSGKLVQWINDDVAFELEIQPMDEPYSRALAQRLMRETAGETFDLGAGKVVRARLFRDELQRALLLVDIHQIATDAWCRDILLKELEQRYNAKVRPDDVMSPVVSTVDHGDFVIWQQGRESGERHEQQSRFWQEVLDDYHCATAFPTDYPRRSVKTNRGDILVFDLSTTVSAQAAQYYREHGSSLYMLSLAVFSILIERYTGQSRTLFGSTVACRDREELREMVGRIANMIPIGVDLAGNPTFEALLSRVREVCLAAYAHQEYPLLEMIRCRRPPRDMSTTPLYQIGFAVETGLRYVPQLESVEARVLPVDKGMAKYDLTFVVAESESNLQIELEYNTDLFNRETMQGLCTGFERLLDEAVTRPTERISDLGSDLKPRATVPPPFVRGLPYDRRALVTAFESIPEVKEARIGLKERAEGLVPVAYVTLADGAAIDVQTLRQLLELDVPSSMLPASVFVVDSLQADNEDVGKAEMIQASDPRRLSSFGQGVLAVCRRVLQQEDLALADDFFARGGDSLLAVELIAAIDRELGVRLPLRFVFEQPVIANLVDHVEIMSEVFLEAVYQPVGSSAS